MDNNDQLTSPLELAIEVTNRCNLNCLYCYCETCFENSCPKKDISYVKFKDIIDEAESLNIFEICISGGECFLQKDIFKYFDYLIKKNLDFSIVTNGTLLGKKEVLLLNDRRLIPNLQISIDSHISKIHNFVRGKYEKTKKAIDLILDLSEDKPSIGSVIHNQNYSTYSETLRYFSDKCSNFHLMNVQASKKSFENKNELFVNSDSLSEFWNEINKVGLELQIDVDIYENDLKPLETARFTGCTAGKTKLVVKPNLDVIPCDITRDIVFGNLKFQTLKEIWDSEKRKEIGDLKVEPCYKLNKKWYVELSR